MYVLLQQIEPHPLIMSEFMSTVYPSLATGSLAVFG